MLMILFSIYIIPDYTISYNTYHISLYKLTILTFTADIPFYFYF